MHGAQDGWVRTGIIDEDDGGGKGKGAGEDLDEEHSGEGSVEQKTAGLSRRGNRRGDDGQVRGEKIREREEQEAETEAADGAESVRQDRVEEQLQRNAHGAENGHHEPDRGRTHSETAGEVEREGLSMMPPRGGRMGRVEARGGEKDEPQVLKAADVESDDAMYEEGAENIAGPEATDRKFGVERSGRGGGWWCCRLKKKKSRGSGFIKLVDCGSRRWWW